MLRERVQNEGRVLSQKVEIIDLGTFWAGDCIKTIVINDHQIIL